MSPSDAVLVSRVLEGNLSAYATLMARYRLRFGRYAYHMLGNEPRRRGGAAGCLHPGVSFAGRCRHPERFAAWLFRIWSTGAAPRARGAGAGAARRAPLEAADGVA